MRFRSTDLLKVKKLPLGLPILVSDTSKSQGNQTGPKKKLTSRALVISKGLRGNY